MKKLFLISLFLLLTANTVLACTNIAITKGASVDGVNTVMMTADGTDIDFRLVRVPAADYPSGSKRPVYEYKENYPMLNGVITGYKLDENFPKPEPLGFIDQVPHTYAYFNAAYGLMNEHQLAIAEDTSGSKYSAQPEKGKRIFDISALSRVAMERCTKAKEAVELMGDLAEKYGYYGGGECLTVADTEEIWDFEIDVTPKGKAVWVAKLIPDGTVFVSANLFRIRDVIPGTEGLLYSKDLFKNCEEAGWYNSKKDKTFDWLKVVTDGEYFNPMYANRRVWRILDLVAPSLKLPKDIEDSFSRAYPFSVKADKKLTTQDMFRLFRDWYQDTEYDLSKGIAAGPFGNINRFDTRVKGGAWERGISLYRTYFSYIAQCREGLPDPIGGIFWWGCAAPHATCYVPFYCGISELPEAYSTGYNKKINKKSAWWAFNYLSNIMNIKFSYMLKDVQIQQQLTEAQEFAAINFLDKKAADLYTTDKNSAIQLITDYCNENAVDVYKNWWKLCDDLILKYQNGYIVSKNGIGRLQYPEEWLKNTNYKPIEYKNSK